MRVDQKLGTVVTTTDLLKFLQCQELTQLDLLRSAGFINPVETANSSELAKRLGLESEYQALDIFEAKYGTAIKIFGDPNSAFESTKRAMADGAGLIYQAVLLDSDNDITYEGRPDFLVKVEGSSNLGQYLYEPIDSKLAKSPTLEALFQVLDYGDLLSKVQGTLPRKVHLFLSGSEQVFYITDLYIEAVRIQKERYLRTLSDLNVSNELSGDELFARLDPKPNNYCSLCDWSVSCEKYWELSDSLNRVAGISRSQIDRLNKGGVTSLDQLARLNPDHTEMGIPRAILKSLIAQAKAQLRTRELALMSTADTGGKTQFDRPYFELREDAFDLAINDHKGLGLLPLADPGDIFFDIEGDPFYKPDGLEYLLGVSFYDSGQLQFKAFWGTDLPGERKAFGELIDFIIDRWKKYPNLHIYHYADYERAALAKLASRCNFKIFEVDSILRSDLLVDLYPIVKGTLVLGADSYSLKKVEKLYLEEQRHESVTTAMGSVESFEAWLVNQDPTLLEEIERYNEMDVRSTAQLRDFLLTLRTEVEEQFGSFPYRSSASKEEKHGEMSDKEAEFERLESSLRSKAEQEMEPDLKRVYQLCSDLVRYHTREDKPIWWRYFNLINSERELHDYLSDPESIGGIEKVGQYLDNKGNTVCVYSFDPQQSIKTTNGSMFLDPEFESESYDDPTNTVHRVKVGSIMKLDLVHGKLEVKKNPKYPSGREPKNLIGWNYVSANTVERCIGRFASWLAELDSPIDTCEVGLEILKVAPPKFIHDGVSYQGLENFRKVHQGSGSDQLENLAKAASLHLDNSYLIIQGPPGAGKTYLSAKVITELVNAGKKVFVSANGHAAIDNLFEALLPMIENEGVLYRVGKNDKSQRMDGVCYIDSKEIASVISAAEGGVVVGGTIWAGARDDLEKKFDYGFIDEAGQFSLANAVALASSCMNLVMSGDPQQLSQPVQGSHPPQAASSVLEYLVEDREVVDPDYGIFLPYTYRMHPDITEVVSAISYDSMLSSDPVLSRLELVDSSPLPKCGIVYIPVPHYGNVYRSQEEVKAAKKVAEFLSQRSWVDKFGDLSRVTPDQIMVVAPYNAQTNALSIALEGLADVGTVDKFQGKEAAFVILSLAASDGEGSSRGIDFLFSTNRLNVAISRAKVMSVIIASPTLLQTRPRTIDQLELLGAMAKVAKSAKVVELNQLD